MRPKLLKSFITVVTFWFIATTLWWALQKPEVNLAALQKLKELFPFIPVSVPAEATILGSLGVQMSVLLYWSIPMLVGTAVSAAIGYGFVWWRAKASADARKKRETGKGEFRGVTVTVGELPVPSKLPMDEIEIGTDSGDENLARLTEREIRVLEEVLGTISAHPDAYAGDGVSSDLLTYTVGLVTKAIQRQRSPGLCAIVAAAHQLGKITAFQRKDDGWVQVKNVDMESARILATLDSWHALPSQDRNAVLMAVKFFSNPLKMPEIESDAAAYRLAKDLLFAHADEERTAVQEEKRKVLEEKSETLPDLILNTFIRSLPLLSFQNRGLSKGVQAVAWKHGRRIYLLEIKLRETIMPKLPADIRGALSPERKGASRLQPFTVELLKALDEKGWLVRQHNNYTLNGTDAIWNIKAGKLEFKGVIVVDIPDEYKEQLPADDSMYEVTITGPLFATQPVPDFKADDLFSGGLLKPGSANSVEGKVSDA
jgi:hypothetical protein